MVPCVHCKANKHVLPTTGGPGIILPAPRATLRYDRSGCTNAPELTAPEKQRTGAASASPRSTRRVLADRSVRPTSFVRSAIAAPNSTGVDHHAQQSTSTDWPVGQSDDSTAHGCCRSSRATAVPAASSRRWPAGERSRPAARRPSFALGYVGVLGVKGLK